MPTISANVTKKELDVIREFSNACGETISNLIKKAIMQMMVPKETEAKEESPNDKLRKMLGLDKEKSREITLDQFGEELGLLKRKDFKKYLQDFR